MPDFRYKGKKVGGSNNIASDIFYDNSASGLESGTVQGAIDEVNNNLTNMIKKVSYNGTSTSAGNITLSINLLASENICVGCTINGTTLIASPYVTGSGYWAIHITDVNGEKLADRVASGEFCYIPLSSIH